jgi:hypothetical protein
MEDGGWTGWNKKIQKDTKICKKGKERKGVKNEHLRNKKSLEIRPK